MTLLEDRCTPAVISVTSLADTVAVDGTVSLREAMLSLNAGANVNADVAPQVAAYGTSDQIVFFGQSGTITLADNLPRIDKTYAITGQTGAGYTNRPVIAIDGTSQSSSASGTPGFSAFWINAPDVVISGLSIIRSRNFAIEVVGTQGSGARIQANRIGFDLSGAPSGNTGAGVSVRGGATGVLIGGPSSADGNIIGNNSAGVELRGVGTAFNTVVGNRIGGPPTPGEGLNPILGSNVAKNRQQYGVFIADGATQNIIGGPDAGARNFIFGHLFDGVFISSTASRNVVLGNSIGVDPLLPDDPTAGNGRHGVLIANGASGNEIGGTTAGERNIITNNALAGIAVGGASNPPMGNDFLGNSIYSNGGLGIDLNVTSSFVNFGGVTGIDGLDSDAGPNGLQNHPLIRGVVGNQVFGLLISTTNSTFRVEFFSNTALDASKHGEGQTFLGFLDVTTDASGKADLSFNAPSSLVGQFVSATATGSEGTSEFSNARLGIPAPTPTPTPTPQPVPNPIPTATPPAQPILVPQLLPGTPFLVPLLMPSATPQLVPSLVPQLAPVPVVNTPVTAPTGNLILFPTPGGPTVSTGVPTVQAGQIAPTAGSTTALQPKAPLVVGAGLNGHSIVVVYNADGTERGRLTAFPGFFGGVRVGTADVNNDGHPDLLAAAGIGGGPHVKVFSGVDGSELRSFFAFDSTFTGGVYVAGGDLNGDGFAEIITGAGLGGGPHVKVFDGQTGAEIAGFFAYDPAFRGGVAVATGDLNNDGLAEVITGAGFSGGPHVKVIEGTSLLQKNTDGSIADAALLASYFAYDSSFRGGVFVASGSDLNSDGFQDVVTGAGPGGAPHVKIINTALTTQEDSNGQIADAALLGSFMAFEESFTGGVRVGEADALQDGVNEIIVGAGATGGPRVRVFRANGLTAVEDFFAFVPEFTGGVFVD